MKILAYIGFFIFSVSWSIVTTALLPAESVDGRKKDDTKYDERQRRMFLEIFARTFVWVVYAMLSSVFLRLFGIYKKVSESLFIFKDYPELLYILLGLLFLVMNYFSVKKKYTT